MLTQRTFPTKVRLRIGDSRAGSVQSFPHSPTHPESPACHFTKVYLTCKGPVVRLKRSVSLTSMIYQGVSLQHAGSVLSFRHLPRSPVSHRSELLLRKQPRNRPVEATGETTPFHLTSSNYKSTRGGTAGFCQHAYGRESGGPTTLRLNTELCFEGDEPSSVSERERDSTSLKVLSGEESSEEREAYTKVQTLIFIFIFC